MKTDKKKILNIALDLLLSIGGLVIMNGAYQLLVNPLLTEWMGEDAFGDLTSINAVVAIMGTTFGVAANYSRMVMAREKRDANGDYNIFLTVIALLCIPVAAGTLIMYKSFSPLGFFLLTILMIATVLRYYGDVNYRMDLNYKIGFFVYYVAITVGYCIGLLLYKITGQWMLTFLLGEVFAVIFVTFYGKIFKGKNLLKPSPNFKPTMKSVGILSGTNLLSAVAQQADKILLRLIVGSESVTTFYYATLFGKAVSMLTTPLNGVLIGYLTKYEGKFTKKMFAAFVGVLLGIGFAAMFACLIGSLIFIKLMYSKSIYDATKPYFFLANAGQIFYFLSNCLMTVILRIASEKHQMFINIIYIILYAALVIPLTFTYGLWGMTIALLITNAAKFLIVTLVGFAKIKKNNLVVE